MQNGRSLKKQMVLFWGEAHYLQAEIQSLRDRRSRVIEAFLHEQAISQDVYREQLEAVTADIATLQDAVSTLQGDNLDIDRALNACAWVLENAARAWVTADLAGRQRLHDALFPDGLRYSGDPTSWNPANAKGWNALRLNSGEVSTVAEDRGLEPRRA